MAKKPIPSHNLEQTAAASNETGLGEGDYQPPVAAATLTAPLREYDGLVDAMVVAQSVDVTLADVFAFREYDTHYIVVTTAGQKLRGDK